MIVLLLLLGLRSLAVHLMGLSEVAIRVLGDDAATAALGLFLHYFIATSMSLTYFIAAQRWTGLRERPLRYGPAYGLLLYAIMNYVVVPLSGARGGGPGGALWKALSIVVHMFLIGVPIAMFTKRAFRTPEPESRATNVRGTWR